MELPTGHELYEKYKGQKATFDNMEGIVCGYSSESAQMICAITYRRFNNGWKFFQRESDDNIITHRNNPEGYFYCTERRIAQKS